jgi:hypothetical protein
MTTPTFIDTDETAFDDDRALTAEHGRRIVRNALAIFNERAGAVGNAQRLVKADGVDQSSRVIITANWAYVGPLHYYCPTPCGEPNISRPTPTVRLMLTGRSSGYGTSYVYAVNQTVGTPSEDQMSADVASGPGAAWKDIFAISWSALLEVPVTPGWNTIWIGFLCGLYGEPEDLSQVIDGETYYAYLAETTFFLRTNDSHPAILSPRDAQRDCPNFAVLVATTAADIAAGVFSRYTVPLVNRNIPFIDEPGALFLLWEPFKAELSRIGAVIQSNFPPWFLNNPNVFPPVAFRQSMDVIDLDSIAVDGSQVWQLEDSSSGAGLRWWQLPSALQFRQAANMAQKARIAVAPQVAIANNVAGVQEYPLPTTGGKSTVWGEVKTCFLTFDPGPPYAQPSATVILEACLSVVVTCLNQREPTVQATVQVEIEIVNMATGIVQQAATATMPIGVIQPGAGSLDGTSVLARTIGWSKFYAASGLTQYGQEGLTRRNDWRVWQPIRVVVSESRIVLTSTPYFMRATVSLPSVTTPTDFILTVSDLAVRIVGG